MRGNVLFLTSKLWFPDFNSRLYMIGSRGDWNVRMRVYISIHASTWEAASIGNRQFNHTVISIHASAWEATPFVLQYGFDTFYFNSRLCMRGNPGAIASGWDTLFQFSPLHERQRRAFLYRYQYLQISIHASTWEATCWSGAVKKMRYAFQFTPLHERQRSFRDGRKWRGYFNSRLYTRGNQYSRAFNTLPMTISIHASTREATAKKH